MARWVPGEALQGTLGGGAGECTRSHFLSICQDTCSPYSGVTPCSKYHPSSQCLSRRCCIKRQPTFVLSPCVALTDIWFRLRLPHALVCVCVYAASNEHLLQTSIIIESPSIMMNLHLLRGHTPPTETELVESVESIMAKHRLKSATFFGHSFGSIAVSWMARRRPHVSRASSICCV